MTARQEICQRGHNNWYEKSNGQRTCRTCKAMMARVRRGGSAGAITSRTWAVTKGMGDRGERDDAFTLAEIKKARGYGE